MLAFFCMWSFMWILWDLCLSPLIFATQSFVSNCCMFVRLLSKHPSILYLNRSPQTGTHRLFSCVYGVVRLESLSDLPYLSLITQLAAPVLSRVAQCVWGMQGMWDGVNVQQTEGGTCCEGVWGLEMGFLGCGGSREGWTWVNQSGCCRHEVTGCSRLQQRGNFGGVSSFIGGWVRVGLTPFVLE